MLATASTLVSTLLVGSARSETNAPGLIAFTRSNGIYVMRADGSGVRPLRRGSVASSAWGLAWSPDGRKLAFTAAARAIWVLDADGSDLVRLVAAEDTFVKWLGAPTWSPRGHTIAFTATRDDERNPDVWVVNADGSNLRRLATTPRLWEFEVDWSPAGGRIAATDIGPAMFAHLRVLTTDGRNVGTLNPGWAYEAATPRWSPDGRKIAFTRWRGSPRSAEIWVTDGSFRSRLGLTNDKVRDSYPVWSPDGRKIAFVRGGGKSPLGVFPKDSEIYVINADGTELTRLTHNRMAEWSPAWQPVAIP